MSNSDLQRALQVIQAAQEDARVNTIRPFEDRAVAVLEAAISEIATIAAEASVALEALGLGELTPPLPETLRNGCNPLFLGPLGNLISARQLAVASTPAAD